MEAGPDGTSVYNLLTQYKALMGQDHTLFSSGPSSGPGRLPNILWQFRSCQDQKEFGVSRRVPEVCRQVAASSKIMLRPCLEPGGSFHLSSDACFLLHPHILNFNYPFSDMPDTILSHISDMVLQTLSQLCLPSTYRSFLTLSNSLMLHQMQTIYLCFSWHISNLFTCHGSDICFVKNVKLLWP